MRTTAPLAAFHALRAHGLRRRLRSAPLPRHLALIMDGNRRWARRAGLTDPGAGHRRGAEHVAEVLSWCESLGIGQVSVFVCSAENLRRRGATEVASLMRTIEEVVTEHLRRPDSDWRVRIAGSLDALPDSTARALRTAVESTRDRPRGSVLTLAVGYGGRQEVVHSVRELLREQRASGTTLNDLAARLTADDIGRHLYTAGAPDPELVIRTSGERRVSNFLLWQSAHSELYFCDAYWPAFREIDFLRALHLYALRRRHTAD
ncbi:polyprenyl diphosphate synthase [Streptomyces sp. NPDC020141]|uniref:polyprenyl diphosphate synthase n=1 Tax=Streptomyces sp. NPDC020141 TaxID=3365065 RepID=UPI00379B0639